MSGKVDRINQDTGKLGEKIAERFLASRDFSILDRNYATPFGEIDLVAKQNGYTVFLEVKTRVSERFGPPLSSITEIKKKHIIRNCRFYLKRHGLLEAPCRIDAIGISLNSQLELQVLKHVKNAIELTERHFSYKL